MRITCELVECDQCGQQRTVPVGSLPAGWIRWRMNLAGIPDPQECDACGPACALGRCACLLRLPEVTHA